MKINRSLLDLALLIVLAACGPRVLERTNVPQSSPQFDAGSDETFGSGEGQGGAKVDAGIGPGGNVLAGQQALSGARLKARFYRGEDGSEVFLDMYDSVRGERCFFLTATDNSVRCLPYGSGATSTGYFADSGCIHQVFVSPLCATVTTGIAMFSSACSVGYSVHSVVPLSAGAKFYSRSEVGVCTEAAFSPSPGASYFRSTGEVDPANFVKAAVVAR
jgi:hypothetical protein